MLAGSLEAMSDAHVPVNSPATFGEAEVHDSDAMTTLSLLDIAPSPAPQVRSAWMLSACTLCINGAHWLLLRHMVRALRSACSDPEQVQVTASTGIAACNIGGVTLHRFAGIGLGDGDV